MASTTTTTRSGRLLGLAALLPDHRQHPYGSLLTVFGIWKALLLTVAVFARFVSPAYDTSGSLLAGVPSVANTSDVGHAVPVGNIVSRLTSWDAIYFMEVARRGYRYEQEWAFGAGLPLTVSSLRSALSFFGISLSAPVVGAGVAHAAHLLSVLLLYRLGRQVWLGDAGKRTAFVAACLHIFSPAGIFLSAPYQESSCALFSFAGLVAFVAACQQDRSASSTTPRLSLSGDLLRLLAGVLFGIATVFRSNGVLNGIVFAYEALFGLLHFVRQPSLPLFRRLAVIGIGGVFVAAGSIVPQTVAYLRFCLEPSGVPGEDVRPWCTYTVPRIYTFVQARYWDVGPFKYWTLGNLTMFLLAGPMLLVLTRSGLDVWADVTAQKTASDAKKVNDAGASAPALTFNPDLAPLLRCMAATQVLLAFLAFTSYHVQIITRLSSGYPLWYWWLAQSLAGGQRSRVAGDIVIFMVMYACIQSILFASFIPPA